MNPELRRAWTEIVTAEDYEEHMRAVGQAQAAAALTQWLLAEAGLGDRSLVAVAGAGTGQMLDFLDAGILRNYRLTFTDLNPVYLAHLRERLARYGLEGVVKEDDFEETRLDGGMDLLLATLLLEHIDWRRGVESIARLRPRACGIVMQENPPGMTTSVTPGRRVPPSLAKAMETAHATLLVREELLVAMAERGFGLRATAEREVADGKRLVALLFGS
jgi:hypothetical protein